MAKRRRREGGAAVVDFVLVLVVLIPLVLGIIQVGLVLLVRNTMSSAASEGARLAATADRSPIDGIALTREQIGGAISGRFAQDITVRRVIINDAPHVEITVRAEVPALGLFGPSIEVEVAGSAVEEPR